jgi:Flp pilus assembly protein protease CpaA
MRWFLLLVSLAGFSYAYIAKTPEALGLSLLAGFLGLVGAFFGFAAARVAATARPDAALLTDKDISALRASVAANRKAPPKPPTPPVAG